MNKTKLIPSTDNQYRTQDQWAERYNEKNQIMVSVAHLFQIYKEKNFEEFENLKPDFKKRWLTTSTRIIYNKENLSAKLIHNVNSRVTKEITIELKNLPVYQPTYIKDLLKTEEGLEFLRALINDKNTKEETIIDFFKTLSGKEENKIRLWTPTQSERESRPIRSVDLVFGDLGRFVVSANDWFGDYDGFSRGVIINSAKQTQFSSNKAIFDIDDETITIPMQKKLLKDIEKKQSEKSKVKIKWKLEVQLK